MGYVCEIVGGFVKEYRRGVGYDGFGRVLVVFFLVVGSYGSFLSWGVLFLGWFLR